MSSSTNSGTASTASTTQTWTAVGCLSRLLSSCVVDSDSDEVVLRKKVALLFGMLILPCSLLWMTMLLLLGDPVAAVGPILYFIVVSIGTCVHVRTKNLQDIAGSLHMCIWISPLLMTCFAGGVYKAYNVFLWSMLLSPMSAVFFWNSWKLGLVCLCTASAAVVLMSLAEMEGVYSLTVDMSRGWRAVFTTMNSIFPGAISFVTVIFFAATAKSQRDRLQESIITAKLVTDALVRFDCDEADRTILHSVGDPELEDTLRVLNSNRAYLPDSLAGGQDADGSQHLGDEVTRTETAMDSRKSASTLDTAPNSPKRKPSAAPRGRRSVGDPKRPELGVELRPRHVTLVHMNRRGYLRFAQSAAQLVRFHSTEVDRVLRLLRECKGVLDLWSGDRIIATFNAARDCGTHAQQALAAATRSRLAAVSAFTDEPADLPIVSMVASGKALCGNLGSASSKRHQVIGGVSSSVRAGERLATRMGVDVLCDTNVAVAAEHQFELRRIEYVLFTKVHPDPYFVWEVLAEMAPPAVDEEWMYQITSSDDKWEGWNNTLAEIVRGTCPSLEPSPPEDRLALEALHNAAARREGQPGPLHIDDFQWSSKGVV
eukprot:TRINITY_DN3373_c0_g1_i1.p1 TRINITY_DN3373_c0_g1~~TRINITY_DN3373_c0_g1_i1.p1  ORF type:complete len:599 (+),score=185.37 TRINITY_DN3373_c0_g1_i1:438-2234(+)